MQNLSLADKNYSVCDELVFQPFIQTTAKAFRLNPLIVFGNFFAFPFLVIWIGGGFLPAIQTFLFLSGLYFGLRTVWIVLNHIIYTGIRNKLSKQSIYICLTTGALGVILLATTPLIR